MKSKIFKTSIIGIIFVVMIIINGCSDLFVNPLKDKETGKDVPLLLLDMNFFETKLKIHIIDAETEQYVSGVDLNVYVGGTDSSAIVNYSGEKKGFYPTSVGLLELACDPNVEVSESNPVDIELQVLTDNYFSFPVSVSLTEKGTEDIFIYVLNLSELKSASLIDAGPFNLEYTSRNGIRQYSLPQRTIDNLMSNYPGYELWNISLISLGGTLEAKDFDTANYDINLYDEWGFHYFNTSVSRDRSTQTLKNKTFSTGGYIIASVTKRNNQNYCKEGFQINYSSNVGASTSVSYKVVLSNGKRIEGMHTGTLPFSKRIKNFYYPKNNPVGVIYLTGNAQFDVNPTRTDSINICNNSTNVTLTPKTGLTYCRLTYRIMCPEGQNLAITPSINLQIKEHGSASDWYWVSSSGGVCQLWLKRNTQYDLRFLWDGEWNNFSITTDTNIEAFLESQQGSNFSFYGTSANVDGITVTDSGNQILIDANILMRGAICTQIE